MSASIKYQEDLDTVSMVLEDDRTYEVFTVATVNKNTLDVFVFDGYDEYDLEVVYIDRNIFALKTTYQKQSYLFTFESSAKVLDRGGVYSEPVQDERINIYKNVFNRI